MRWNELSRKTVGILITLGVIFAGTLGVLAFLLIRQRGGDQIARIVRDAVKNQRITLAGEGMKIVADRLLVTFRPTASSAMREDAAKKAGGKIIGALSTEQENIYIVSFANVTTARQLTGLREIFMQSPDVVDVEFIPVE